MDLEERLAELERRRRDGELTEIGYNLQRNLLITRSDELARRRSATAVVTLPPRERTPPSRSAAPARARPAPTAPRHTASPPRAQPAPAGGWRARLTSRPAILASALIVVAAGALAVYHVTSGPAAAASTTAAHPGGAGAVAAPTAAPASSAPVTSGSAPPPTVIDVTQATASGGSVTLLDYADHFASGSTINNPLPAGGFYAAVELRVCAGPAGSTVSPFQFVLAEPGQTTQIGVATGPTVGRQPALSLQELAPGGCTTGWLSYGVTSRPTALDDTGDTLTWAIPG